MNNLNNKSNNIKSLTVSLIIRTNNLSLKALFKKCSIPKIDLTLVLESDLELTDISEMFSDNEVNLNLVESYADVSRAIHVKNTKQHKLKLASNIPVNEFISFNGGQLDVNDLFENNESGIVNLNKMFYNNKYLLSLKRNDIAIMDFTNWSCRNNPIIDLSRFLSNTSNIRIIDLSNWNTENCQNFSYCFANIPQIRKIYIDGWKLKLKADSIYNYNNPISTNPTDYHLDCRILNMFENCGMNSTINCPVKIRGIGLTMYLLSSMVSGKLTLSDEPKEIISNNLDKTINCLCVFTKHKITGVNVLNIISAFPID